MKKAALASIILFAAVGIVFAQAKDVSVRSGKHNGAVRLVFESEEGFLKNANVSSLGLQMHIKFPAEFNLSPQKGFELETSKADRLLTIYLKEPFDVKVLRLSSPPRLVVDILPKGAEEVKPQPDIVLLQRVFVFDPGHGGYDFGIISSDLKEKDVVLAIAKEMEGLLVKKDKKVFLTRRSDQFVSLKDRATFTNQKMPQIFVSMHVSMSEGFALYTAKFNDSADASSDAYSLSSRQKKYLQKSKALAESIGKAIKEEFNLNVVQREMSLPILNSAGAPAVLIEVPSFNAMGYGQDMRMRLAYALMKGFHYYGQ